MPSFVIPIVDNKANVKFPQKCVYCCQPQEFTLPVKAFRSSGSQYYRQSTGIVFDVPYCAEHAHKPKRLGLILNIIFFACLALSCTTSFIISFALDLQETFQICVLGPGLAFLFAILTGSVGVRKIWGFFNKEIQDLPGFWEQGSLGIQVAMGNEGVGIAFTNEEYAKEFSELNFYNEA